MFSASTRTKRRANTPLHFQNKGRAKGTANRCFCAFCKSPRSIYSKRHISFADFSLAAIGSVLLTWLIWQSFDPRGFMFLGLGLGFSEIFVIMRRRFSIACPKCGFDSVLYRKNPQAAVERVKEFRRERFEDPLWIFSPPVQPPRLQMSPLQDQKEARRLSATRSSTGASRTAGNRHLRSPLRDGERLPASQSAH